ncbi:FKBP-type peptidyl-prolyl cis-trans isomerase [Kitasatospora sp. NBC_01287]|uniref:FKBP-type peptidyl-prolyl cis-trans isomerase n=1 Tax=Kitasatospora sp. NBC_01287 TaxID=2903573 RepID=UPI002250121F|nr:FKBP-type peptidyl-prolyl cis-trans isomerase [Kitasatospora sp. NBC_01287]MCX4750162.1 FKBP-type peptidyl-prolyl cis-trans isomerase [Kitasatospora sp. NBC_01287]
MAENPSGPSEADTDGGAVTGPSGPRPAGPLTGDGESIVIPPSILKQQAGWAKPGESVPTPGAGQSTDEPQVFASTVRKQQTSEADYENVSGGGRLGVVLGVVLAVLLVGSGVGLYVVNQHDDKAAKASDAATATPSAAPSPSAPPVPPLKTDAKVLPTVAGDFGKKATITLPQQSPDGTFVAKSLTEGDGPKINKGDYVSVDFTLKDWQTGKDIQGSYDQGKSLILQPGTGQVIPALDSTLVGQKAGSRVLVVAPPAAAFGDQGNTSLGLGPKDDLVLVIDINRVNAPDARVSGDMTAPPADFPQVKINGGKTADTITPPAGVTDPTDLKTAVLIQGKGPKVESGEQVVVQYTGVTLKDGKKFDSSVEKGQAFSFVTGGGQVIPGWDKGVVGQNVGSRIELVIPAAQAYGASPPDGSGIPANASLVFVIDILDAGQGSGGGQ